MQAVLIEDSEWRDGFGKKLFELQQAGQFCDVIIKTVEDARLLVHSCVLAASSPLLKGVIESALSDASLGTIMLSSDIDVSTWTHMLEFMYTGSASVPDSLVTSLQSGATILKVDTLIDRCNEILPSLIIAKTEVEAVPVEASELYSAIAQIKEDSDEVIEPQDVIKSQVSIEPEAAIESETDLQPKDIIETPSVIEAQDIVQDENEIDEQAVMETSGGMDVHDSIEGREEMETQDYIDDVHDASVTLDYIATSTAGTVTTVSNANDEYKTVDLEDFITTSVQPHSPEENIHAAGSNTTQIVLQTTFHEGNVVASIQPLVFDEKTTNVHEIGSEPGEAKALIVNLTDDVNDNVDIHEYELIGYTTTGKKQYRCCICNAMTLDPSAHRPVHTTECPYVCTEPGCGKAYKRKSALKHHFSQIHTENIPQHCMKCGKAFNNKYLLQKHLNMTCTDAKPFVCRQCGKSFKVLARLKYHEGSHSTDKPFKCSICSKPMATKAHLRVHMVVHENGKHDCTICRKSFLSNKRLSEHNRQMHSLNNPHRCEICERNFKNALCLEKHMLRHVKESKLYLCRICRRGFKNNISCFWHEKKVHGLPHPDFFDVEGDTTCPVCLKIMKNKTSLQTHMTIHGDNDNETFPCEKCEKVFGKRKHLLSHLQDVHVERTTPCLHCNKWFKHEKHLKEHMNSHLKPFVCSYCGARFANKRYLDKHISDHEKGLFKDKIYICPHCDASFPTATNFRLHVAEVHPEKPKATNIAIKEKKLLQARNEAKYIKKLNDLTGNYNCELCDLIFAYEDGLTNHEIKKHVDDNNRLLCDVCDVKFITPRTLKKHQFEVHNIGEEEQCSFCERVFYSFDDLQFHELVVHSIVKTENLGTTVKLTPLRHICFVCTKVFIREHALTKHEEIHEPNFVCKICSDQFDNMESFKEHVHACSNTQCMYCLDTFESLDGYNAHLIQHQQGQIEYKCTLCTVKYATESARNEHINSYHSIVSESNKNPTIKKRRIQTDLSAAGVEENFKSLLQSFCK